MEIIFTKEAKDWIELQAKLRRLRRCECGWNKKGECPTCIPKPCDHPGCSSHMSHPCEQCGMQWGDEV